ncbi:MULTISPECIES: Lrp/AsnC family transcriptional regulator [Aneurinibacillus]|jgi:Lrp/AsnC family leucine-responsive transcriptional regulator|uniref:HTH-type transcriptional regulator LrpB n=1 Tax=Aneurinibacillus danicus TaxID=267746 RepID=A0A511V4R8_9BACL|nr:MULTISPECIES: Lrp/AsnC family transcriptional regulator [Aneurinibacillus]GEN33927.1 HTH-type transcriptional regulator LrpB [Aneurinibacillus danicus]
MFDEADLRIVKLLQENSRMSWKEIGEHVHLTGQAVGNRIRRLEEAGVIEQYTVALNEAKLGRTVTAFITVLMKSANHTAFQAFIEKEEIIAEAHRISGDGCYFLKAHTTSLEELDALLNRILKHGNYRVSLSIGKLKPSFP